MKKRYICFSVISLAALVSLTSVCTNLVVTPLTKLLANSPKSEYGYALTLNATTNVLSSDHGTETFTLENGNTVPVTYVGYSHDSGNSSWGTFSQWGNFQIGTRIGGLKRIEYSITQTLHVQYGYYESGKPTYYETWLGIGDDHFDFPSERGYPDTFRIELQESGSVTINYMTFYYSCSQTDEHVHVYDDTSITRAVESNQYVYYRKCKICESTDYAQEVRFDNYKISIGTNSGNIQDYTPYTCYQYQALGGRPLEFDYLNAHDANTKRFVLNVSGNHNTHDVYVRFSDDANYRDNSQIAIVSSSSAKLHTIKLRGGYGVAVLKGEGLTFDNVPTSGAAYLDTEARVTSIKSPLSFTGNNTQDLVSAIKVTNGKVYLENDITINSINKGFKLHQGQYTTSSVMVQQSSGNINMDTVNWGFYANTQYAIPTVKILSNTTISNVNCGFQDCNINIGDNSHSAKLRVDIVCGDGYQSLQSGILFQGDQQFNFAKGQALFDSVANEHNYKNTAAIYGSNGFNKDHLDRYSVASDFKLGFGRLQYGFYNSHPDGSLGLTSVETTLYLQNGSYDAQDGGVGDRAWGFGTKPAYKTVSNIWTEFGY